MPTNKDAWGIEVGANAIKAIRLQQSGASATLADFEVVPFKKILTTPDLNVDEAIRVGLDEFLTRQRIGKSAVVVSLPGHAVLARAAKLPPVEPKRIGDIVRFEAVQQIPFPIDQVEWDYQTFQDPDSPDVEVGIFAVTKQRLTPWLQNFTAVNMPVHGVAPSLVAVYNALNHDRDLASASGGTVLMDIGTQATDLVICEGHRFWPRTIPIGGNHFTEALVKSFKLSFSKAEKLKREASTSKYARQIFQAMRPVFVDLVQEVQKSLGYYQSLNREADLQRLIGMGSTFRLPGLQTFLKQQLQIEIQRLDQFESIEAGGRDVSTFGDNAISLAPAYGLALQGLEVERVSCNLLPQPMVRHQVWQAKKPWFAAAAAVMLIGTLLAAGNLVRQKAAYNAPENAQARQRTEAVLDRTEAVYAQWREAEGANDPRGRITNINRMLTYRRVWGWVMRDLDRALMALDPQPAVLSGDPEAMADLPREQRRVYHIERVRAAYEYSPPDGAGGVSRAAAANEVDWEQAPPRYRLTIRGTTPYKPADGAFDSPTDFISQRMLQQLRVLDDRAGRPYRTARNAEGRPRVQVTRQETVRGLGEEEADGRPDAASEPRGPAFGGFERGPGVEGGADEAAAQPAAADLSVKRLPGERVKNGDVRIEIEWVIELKPPDQTRRGDGEQTEAEEEAEAEGETEASADGGGAAPTAAETEARS